MALEETENAVVSVLPIEIKEPLYSGHVEAIERFYVYESEWYQCYKSVKEPV